MYKLIVISDKKKNSLSFKIGTHLFDFNSTYMQNSEAILNLLKEETPNFAFVDINKNSEFENFEELFNSMIINERVRVTIFNLDSVKSAFLRILPLDTLDFILSLVFRKKAVKQ